VEDRQFYCFSRNRAPLMPAEAPNLVNRQVLQVFEFYYWLDLLPGRSGRGFANLDLCV